MPRVPFCGRFLRWALISTTLLVVSTPAWSKSLEFSPVARQGLEFLNNGHVLEAYDLVRKARKDAPDDPSILFLLGMSKFRIMFLSTHNANDKAEMVAVLDRLEDVVQPRTGADDDALFYYSAAQGLRAQLGGLDGDWWAAAKLGKKMKRTSEELIERSPDYNEAYYLLGSYNYFADVLPGYIKFFRALLFIPGGSRTGGLEQLNRAYEKSQIASIEAGRTLALIDTYYEKKPAPGVQMCDRILARCPDGFDIGMYKGINLYFGSDFSKAEEWLLHVQDGIHGYSRAHESKEGEVVPVYAAVEREVRYWVARSLIRQKKLADAEKVLLALKVPEIHQPYWIQRGVFLSLAEIDYATNRKREADSLVNTVLGWQDVKEAHDKANLLKDKKGAVGPFDIDFR